MAVAAIAFALMMFVTVADVVGRYGFNRPLTWSFDLMTQYLMVAGFFLVISAAQASRQHVQIDLIARRLPPRVRAAALVPAYALACLMIAVIALTGWYGFERAWTRGLVMDGIIAWPRWPTYLMVAAGAALLSARLAIETLAHVIRAFGIDPGLPVEAEGHGPPPRHGAQK
jgi:TRAP-type C4-dicarboxylate transport system permease small subunit